MRKPTSISPPASPRTSSASTSSGSRTLYERAARELPQHQAARLADAHRLAAHLDRALHRGGGKVAPLAARLKERHGIEFWSIGGGIGIIYRIRWLSRRRAWWDGSAEDRPLTIELYGRENSSRCSRTLGLKILLEPGRLIVGNAGVLLTELPLREKRRAPRPSRSSMPA
jgi:diaminopimelate decarboxylase